MGCRSLFEGEMIGRSVCGGRDLKTLTTPSEREVLEKQVLAAMDNPMDLVDFFSLSRSFDKESLEAWIEFKGASSLTDLSRDSMQCTPAMEFLCRTGSAKLITKNLMRSAQASIERNHLSDFWLKFDSTDEDLQGVDLKKKLPQALSVLFDAVDRCCRNLKSIYNHFSTIDDCRELIWPLHELDGDFRMQVSTLLRRDSAPHSIAKILGQYFKGCLEEFSSNAEFDSEDEMELDDMSPKSAQPRVGLEIMGRNWVEGVMTVSRCSRGLGLQVLSDEACTGAACENVLKMLSRYSQMGCCAEIWPVAKRYVTRVPMEFLKLALTDSRRQLKECLVYFLYESLGELRINNLFDMAVEFPNSMPAVKDLCECLKRTTLHDRLVSVFCKTLSDRLLQAGASTSDIIKHFTLVVRMLPHIDPTGSLQETISGPYRRYLRGRQDTMKCIVTIVTENQEDGGPSMLEEFSESCPNELFSDGEGPDDVWVDEETALQLATSWEPAPAHLPTPGKTSDVISTLVGIYGSKEMFIEEYHKILGDTLMAKTDYECSREVRTVELLKIRFGESALHNCEVMLRDMSESKRLQQTLMGPQVRGAAGSSDMPGQISATIISELFWPKLPGQGIKLPAEIQEKLDLYAKRYNAHKQPRKLIWKTEVGQVELDVTIGGTVVPFTVTPPYAMVLWSFKKATSRMANDLARELGMTPEVLRSKASFWVNSGVLVETRGKNGEVCYRRAKEVDKSRAAGGNVGPSDMEEEEGQSTMVTNSQDMADFAEMKVFHSYIVDYLRNQKDGRPLEHIQRHLQTFVIQPKYDKSQDQLSSFLARLTDLGEINQHGGLYKVCQ
ncbi:hypothetical protein BSKO_10747 [Bryopsis sp. KO-2023]|nr:hypothetical protein BSKO_10747 [Bryopsis sp. KO-2023]